ncbi:hypothetical protein GCM10023185_35080 [Hymenobacter saemangeumensis]|uniref:Uncharacterized protein n=1 Tax=Hymenobacter saemangeumensis TaxID=1084522 RepID=A0ABP8IP88_9BACT
MVYCPAGVKQEWIAPGSDPTGRAFQPLKPPKSQPEGPAESSSSEKWNSSAGARRWWTYGRQRAYNRFKPARAVASPGRMSSTLV